VYPLMTAFNALPKAAFVPILVVWFGIGVGPAILIDPAGIIHEAA
jgi:NitT/TauT family transport system permease protein